MKSWALFIFISVIIFLMTSVFCSLHAVQVLPPQPSFGGQMGRSFGQGFSSGFNQGLQQAMARKQQKKLQEEQEKYLAYQKAVLMEIVQGYDPAKHEESILKVLETDFPETTKIAIIGIFNEQHKAYIEERNSIRGLWSRFKQ